MNKKLKWAFNNSKKIMRFKYWKIIEKEEKNPTMKSCPKKKKLKSAIRNCRGLVWEGGAKKWTPWGQEPSKVLSVEKFQKLLERFKQNIPSNVTRNQEPKYVIYVSITQKSARTAEPSETQTSMQNYQETQLQSRNKEQRKIFKICLKCLRQIKISNPLLTLAFVMRQTVVLPFSALFSDIVNIAWMVELLTNLV